MKNQRSTDKSSTVVVVDRGRVGVTGGRGREMIDGIREDVNGVVEEWGERTSDRKRGCLVQGIKNREKELIPFLLFG